MQEAVKIATIQDVAKAAGVSVATVSRVINNSRNVSVQTKKRVDDAIQKLQYVPNMLGMHLRKNETKKILVLMDSISNQFYSRVAAGIEERAVKDGYLVMLGCTRGSVQTEDSYLEMLRTRLVDGLILFSTQNPPEILKQKLAGLPAVAACEPIPGTTLPFVGIDNEQAAFDAVSFLLERGFRRIAFFGAGDHYPSARMRYAGYQKALAAHQILLEPSLVFQDGYSHRSGERCVGRLLQQCKSNPANPLPDAIFTLSDSCALGTIKTLHEYGISVPNQISVMGFDNTKNAKWAIPEITTVAQPQDQIGYEAADILIDLIKGEQRGDLLLHHEILQRDSVSCKRDIE